MHGPGCFAADGQFACSWPERHDPAFTLPPPGPADRVVIVRAPGSRLMHGLVTALMLAAGLAVLAMGLTISVAHLRFQTVVSNSMRPTFSAGDVAITQEVPAGSLHVGDAIAFYPPGQRTPVLHRITSLERTDAGIAITSRGDANAVDDPWHLTLGGATSYRLVAVVPFIGWLTELQRPALLLAALAALLAVLLETKKGVMKALAITSSSKLRA